MEQNGWDNYDYNNFMFTFLFNFVQNFEFEILAVLHIVYSIKFSLLPSFSS